MKKTIIAGSRTIDDYAELEKAIVDSGLEISFVISGNASGVDKMGERWAREHARSLSGLWIFKADWEKYGKRAGHIRNKEMSEVADALILLWDGYSRGSANMLEIAKAKKLFIYEKNVITQQVTITLDDNPLDM